ncbi:MAG: hypothetical protein ACRDST_12695 [Pseudonocardiaceae bacterium]
MMQRREKVTASRRFQLVTRPNPAASSSGRSTGMVAAPAITTPLRSGERPRRFRVVSSAAVAATAVIAESVTTARSPPPPGADTLPAE